MYFKETTVRQLTFKLTFILSTIFLACGQTKTQSNFEQSKLDIETIDFIEIDHKPEQYDTTQLEKKLLTAQQRKTFVAKWNNAKSVGPIKSMTRHFITVHFKDGTTRKFKGNGPILKENNDFGFDLGDSNFIETIWIDLNIDHMKNIRTVFEDYIQYHESTDAQEDKDLMTQSLKSLTTVTNKGDLDLLINVWMYYDPTDYQDIPEVYRILKGSSPQSIEAVKHRMNNKKTWEADDTSPYSDLKNLLKRLENE